MRKKPANSYVINIDDKVMIKCRHYTTGKKQLVMARLSVIDSTKFYFYPINKHYRESIYTLSTLNEIGIKTNINKVLTAGMFVYKVYNIINGRSLGMIYNQETLYKMVNVKTRKWDVRLIDNEIK